MKHFLHNSLRALFLSLAVLLAMPMLAEKVEIDGIWYNLESEGKQAEVTYKGNYSYEYTEYSGVVVIPASVVYNGTTYSVTSIGDWACWGSDLTSVTIPNSVTSIGYRAFSASYGLTSVTIGNSVKSIGDYAFIGCDGLTSVTIPNSVTSIGSAAFSGCDGLTSVTIPNSVTSIGANAFEGCSGLTSVTIGSGVTSIGERAFVGCSGLTSVTIPNSVTSIEGWAFNGCTGLTSVTIGSGVTSIGEDAFYYCNGLTSVHISDIAAWCNIDFSSSSSNPLSQAHHLYMNGEEVKDLVIPNSVTSIGDDAFYHCDGLTSVTIPNSVTSIGERAFTHCYDLTSVTIGSGVTSIGYSAFYYCTGLTSVTIGSGVTSIGEYAFSYCFKLLDVHCYAEEVPSTESSTFFNSPIASATLHVPNASIESYETTSPWRSFGKIVGLSNEYSLTVSSVGYATLYLDFNAKIPGGVKAYVAKEVVDSRLKMELVEGVLPANTGVIIMAEEGTYAFVESDETPAVIEKNLLKGTVEKTEITAEANTSYYVLSAPDGVVAMYLALLTENKFWNNANKAYLPISNGDLGIFDDEVDSSVEQLSRRLVFDFGDETGIDEVKTENANVKTAVYDLSGRRIQNAQKGIYIQNGKLMVK